MARVNVETRALADARLLQLTKTLKCRRQFSIGLLVLLWHSSQDRLVTHATRDQVGAWIDAKDDKESNRLIDALIKCEYLEEEGDALRIRGNKKHVQAFASIKESRSVAGRKGGVASGAKRSKTKQPLKQNEATEKKNEPQYNTMQFNSMQCNSIQSNSIQNKTEQELNLPTPIKKSGTAPTSEVWKVYSDEYRKRYGTEPVRNASVNGILSNFVRRLPVQEAHLVAGFYVTHNDAFYVKQMHPVGLLLKDAEKLRTEWKSGNAMTGQKAREIERVQTNADTWDRAAEAVNEKIGKEKW